MLNKYRCGSFLGLFFIGKNIQKTTTDNLKPATDASLEMSKDFSFYQNII